MLSSLGVALVNRSLISSLRAIQVTDTSSPSIPTAVRAVMPPESDVTPPPSYISSPLEPSSVAIHVRSGETCSRSGPVILAHMRILRCVFVLEMVRATGGLTTPSDLVLLVP